MATHDSNDYITINKANWDERAPEHAQAPSYAYQRLFTDPTFLSDVVTFDIPLLGPVTDLRILHLQCHIGTDTISLARRGATEVVGLDFSPASLVQARHLVTHAAGGEKLSFVESDVYSAPTSVHDGDGIGYFDLVFTGIGALCWLPDIRRWARTVAAMLRPGGRLFLREGHPMMWAIDETVASDLVIRYPYFARDGGTVFESATTYVKLADEAKVFASSKTVNFNHGLGEIVGALLEVGMRITGLVEHRSVPWNALPGRMTELENGEFVLKENQDWVPLTYTLQAVKGN